MYKHFYVCRRILVTLVTEEGPKDPLVSFSTSLVCQNMKKLKGVFSEKKKFKQKSHNAETTERGTL